jgi:DNA-binding transcriptional regulator YiaG
MSATIQDIEALALARRLLASGRAVEIRKRYRLTQTELSEVVGVASATISRWEGGSRTPRGAAAKRYGHLLRQLATEDELAAV